MMFAFLKNIFASRQLDYPTLIGRGAVIIDVRAHVKNALNIPLVEIQNHFVKLKRNEKPIIACCSSGARSGRATKILIDAGIETYNGGSWTQVKNALANL
jgi:phage shock protein E